MQVSRRDCLEHAFAMAATALAAAPAARAEEPAQAGGAAAPIERLRVAVVGANFRKSRLAEARPCVPGDRGLVYQQRPSTIQASPWAFGSPTRSISRCSGLTTAASAFDSDA